MVGAIVALAAYSAFCVQVGVLGYRPFSITPSEALHQDIPFGFIWFVSGFTCVGTALYISRHSDGLPELRRSNYILWPPPRAVLNALRLPLTPTYLRVACAELEWSTAVVLTSLAALPVVAALCLLFALVRTL